ncbi:MAG: bifunctional nuclease family protein [Nitrospirales bacterium]|nr:bifunctional nuclease family protein [Nitrospirales bacterium]
MEELENTGGIVEHDATLIPLIVHGVLVDPNTDTQIVILRDETNTEVLPIWVGATEGTSIRLALEGIIPPRPMSHDLITSFMDHLGTTVKQVVVTDVKNNTYYATIHLSVNGMERTVDARPSDAIALALRAKIPVCVTQEILKQRGDENREAWLAKLEPKQFGQSEA